ncbi:hypothetical protein, partial [Bacteroides sp. 51]|uniref:hypothetical protein n=1 Tax=Bacteroides sp. 51 TaxID=2302938 RepID=UPI00194026DC
MTPHSTDGTTPPTATPEPTTKGTNCTASRVWICVGVLWNYQCENQGQGDEVFEIHLDDMFVLN